MTDTNATTITSDATTSTTAAPQMTAAEATTKLADLTANHEWSTKLLAGDGPTVKEFHALSAAKTQTRRRPCVSVLDRRHAQADQSRRGH